MKSTHNNTIYSFAYLYNSYAGAYFSVLCNCMMPLCPPNDKRICIKEKEIKKKGGGRTPKNGAFNSKLSRGNFNRGQLVFSILLLRELLSARLGSNKCQFLNHWFHSAMVRFDPAGSNPTTYQNEVPMSH